MDEFSVNYYDVLRVSPRAGSEEISRAYRMLALQHHPDRGGDPARMVQLNQAYDVLNDSSQRQVYDEYLGIDRFGPGVDGAGMDTENGDWGFAPESQAGPVDPAPPPEDEQASRLLTVGRWLLAATDALAVGLVRMASSDSIPWLICYGAVLLVMAGLVQHLTGLFRLP